MDVIERIADGLGITGQMLGLAPRGWEGKPSLPVIGSRDDVAPVPHARYSLEETLTAADSARRLMDRTLAGRTVTPGHVDALEDATARHARNSVFTRPLEMLNTLLLDFDEIRRFSAEAQSPDIQCRLYLAAAQVAALAADELMVLGNARQAWAWHSTAKIAADATSHRATMAQVRAVGTLIPLYYGDSAEAASTAHEVRSLIGTAREGKVSAASVLAATLEALALAQVGDISGSEMALNIASASFDRLDASQRIESVFGFSERRWNFYQARIISLYGDFERAWGAQERALSLYPKEVVGDPSIIRLDRAASLIRHGDIEGGCELARQTLLAMPTQHRTDIFLDRGSKVLDTIEPKRQSMPVVREFSDLMITLRDRKLRDGD